MGRRMGHGYALVAVLWMISALMLLVSALVFHARTELRVVAAGRDTLVAEGLADAGIHLAARAIASDSKAFSVQRTLDLEFDGVPIRVVVTPLTGLISLNLAPQSLLAALFAHGAKIDPGFAEVLAQRVIDWRDPDVAALPQGAENPEYVSAGSQFRTRGGAFEAPEDVLQVLGVDLEIYDKIKELVTVDGGSARINPLAATDKVLFVLAKENAAVAGKIASARDAGLSQIDTTSLMQEFIDQSSSSRFRLKVFVPMNEGRLMAQSAVVDVSPPQLSRLPWIVLRKEHSYMVNSSPVQGGGE